MPPSICAFTWSGLTATPQSTAQTTFSTLTVPSSATETSATSATKLLKDSCTAIPGFRLAADWTDIRLTGGIENLDIDATLASCYDSADFPNNAACGAFRRLTAPDIASGHGTETGRAPWGAKGGQSG